jgi:hypothetical protein
MGKPSSILERKNKFFDINNDNNIKTTMSAFVFHFYLFDLKGKANFLQKQIKISGNG